MSQVVSEGRIVRILKRLKIFDQWEVAKWAYQQGWEIDKSNFIFWTVMNILGALIPVYLLRVTQEVVNSITIGVETSDFKKVTWRVALLCALWILQSSYNIIPNIIKYTMHTRYSSHAAKYAAFVNAIPLYKFDNKEFSIDFSGRSNLQPSSLFYRRYHQHDWLIRGHDWPAFGLLFQPLGFF